VREKRNEGGYEYNKNRYVFYKWGKDGNKYFTAVKVSRQRPLVLLVKVCRSHGRGLRSKEDRVTGRGLFRICSRGQELRMLVGVFVW
jgi:hypothetical protein